MVKFTLAVCSVLSVLCWYDPDNQETRAYWEHRIFPQQARTSALPVDDSVPREISKVDNRLIRIAEGDLR